jgi:hypothetical protein
MIFQARKFLSSGSALKIEELSQKVPSPQGYGLKTGES